MKKGLIITGLLSVGFSFTSCTENYSNGNRVGYVTKFSEKGLIWKSWEGELNMTQTGMNSSGTFNFSVDNDINNPTVIQKLKTALDSSFMVELTYHETAGKNWFSNRGETNYFITNVKHIKNK